MRQILEKCIMWLSRYAFIVGFSHIVLLAFYCAETGNPFYEAWNDVMFLAIVVIAPLFPMTFVDSVWWICKKCKKKEST